MPVLNIKSDSDDWCARCLSNLSSHSFFIDGEKMASVEGFIQGIKFPKVNHIRKQSFQSVGVDAKRLGKKAECNFVWWKDKIIEYGSVEHHKLINKAICCKFNQNADAMKALLETDGLVLVHDTGHPDSPKTSLPADIFCKILTNIRKEKKMNRLFENIFTVKKPITGMIHVWAVKEEEQIRQVLDDLQKMHDFVDGVIVENYGWGYEDSNFASDFCFRIIKEIAEVVVKNSKIPVGINILPNDYRKSFRVADETGCKFIQMDHVYGEFYHCTPVYPQHFMRLREKFPNIAVLGGIHPKYYELINKNQQIAVSAQKAKKLADAIVVTGKCTGGEADIQDLETVKLVIGDKPLIVGSGLSVNNATVQLKIADGAIVGTAFKRSGVRKGEPIDTGLVKGLMEEVKKLR